MLIFKGNSGCSLELKKNKVIKYSSSKEYNDRLFNQYKKQNNFIVNDFIKTPKCFYFNKNEEINYFTMEYINGESFITFFQRNDWESIKNIFIQLFKMINENIKKSNFKKINNDKILKKIYSIKNIYKSNLFNDELLNKYIDETIKEVENNFSEINYLEGYNHGDLTLSNILFFDKKVYLIDFLDSFIETPFQDIIKLRQDLKFHWSFLKNNEIEIYNKNKVLITMEKLNEMLISFFKNDILNNLKFIKLLEVINYLRIIPYIKDNETKIFLKEVLGELCKNKTF